MAFATAAPVEVARVVEYRNAVLIFFREAQTVTTFGFFNQCFEVDALDPAGSANKAAINHIFSQTHGFEDLCATVGLQCGDAHLGHNLEHALGNRFLVGGNHVAFVRVIFAQQTVQLCLPDRLKGHVGVDGVGAITYQQTVVMYFTRFTSLDDQADLGALVSTNQVVMHGTGGYQGADRSAILADLAVRQDNKGKTIGDGLAGFLANAVQTGLITIFCIDVVSDINHFAAQTVVVHAANGLQLLVRQNRVLQAQSMGVLLGGFQQVAFRTDKAFQ